MIDRYTAVVKMIDSGDKLKLDQTHLETVIPAPGTCPWTHVTLGVDIWGRYVLEIQSHDVSHVSL